LRPSRFLSPQRMEREAFLKDICDGIG